MPSKAAMSKPADLCSSLSCKAPPVGVITPRPRRDKAKQKILGALGSSFREGDRSAQRIVLIQDCSIRTCRTDRTQSLVSPGQLPQFQPFLPLPRAAVISRREAARTVLVEARRGDLSLRQDHARESGWYLVIAANAHVVLAQETVIDPANHKIGHGEAASSAFGRRDAVKDDDAAPCS